jgi:sialate O-acetylesterase
VLVGEVWLASGQSNMDFSLSKKVKYFAGVTNEAGNCRGELSAHPHVHRHAHQNRRRNQSHRRRMENLHARNRAGVLAVGYFFARDLQKEIKVPVGIIAEAFGASTAEAWIDRATLAAIRN